MLQIFLCLFFFVVPPKNKLIMLISIIIASQVVGSLITFGEVNVSSNIYEVAEQPVSQQVLIRSLLWVLSLSFSLNTVSNYEVKFIYMLLPVAENGMLCMDLDLSLVVMITFFYTDSTLDKKIKSGFHHDYWLHYASLEYIWDECF